uniref:uncharacterized protein LOC120326790 n=1 Tax=Styela clava TaxID=7725 RepID=UPI001939E72F|nr:uncharacterized protein LOC120326790 [Styela clava]
MMQKMIFSWFLPAVSHRYYREFATTTIKMKDKIPRLLLFDIDGTLTKSHYKDSVNGHPMARALSEAFGKSIKRNAISFAGGTDRSIIRDVLQGNGITEDNTTDYEKRVIETLRILPEFMRTGIAEGNYSWSALPNVHKLLQRLSQIEDVRLALLTGNIVEDARIKLECASIDISLFEVESSDGKKELLGAFGSDHEVRSKLVPFAKKRYSDLIGQQVLSQDMIIIGDSPKDITCAHDNGVACVAVGTGPSSYEHLTDADHLLKDGFKNIDESIDVILRTKIMSS